MPKLLIVHNAYRHRGGEDICVENEVRALRDAHWDVELFVERNDSTIKTIVQGVGAPFGWALEKQVEDRLRTFQPDIVHVHNLFPSLSPRVFAAAHAMAAATVLTLHNYRPLCLNGLFLTPAGEICERCAGNSYWPGIVRGCYRDNRLQSLALATHLRVAQARHWYQLVDRFITPSRFLKERLLHYKWTDEAKIDVQGHFVPETIPTVPEKAEPYALYLGRLSEEKGVRWLLHAFSQRSMGLKLQIAGEGPLKNLVLEAQQKNPAISYRGYLEGVAKKECLSRASVLVLPSRCYENFPLAIMEANSLGVPVVVSRLGAMPEQVESGRNGLSFIPDDIASWTDALQQISKVWTTAEKRAQCQQYAHKQFSVSTFLTRRQALYEKLLIKTDVRR